MRKSSTCPARNGSPAYWERPIQLCVVLPRLDGRRVIAPLRPTSTPSTYRMPTPPDSVTATCFQTPAGSGAGPLTRVAVRPPPDESAAVVPPVSSNRYQATGPGPALAPSARVMATCVPPGWTTTVPDAASSVPPLTPATPTLRNCGSWTSTG